MSRTLRKASGLLAAGALASLSMISGVAANAQTVEAVGTGGYVREPDTYQTIGDNVRNYAEGSGGVNCRGGDTCVEKVGDTAEVEWMIQVSNGVTSSDDSQISGQPVILVPEVVKNLSVTINALPDDEAYAEMLKTNSTLEPAFYPAQEVNAEGVVVDADAPEAASVTNALGDKDMAGAWGIIKDDSAFGGVDPDTQDRQGNRWDAYAVPVSGAGIVTLTLKGEVTVESEDTYIPIRVTSSTWHCLLEVCDSLQTYDWARLGALPEFSLTDPEINARVAALQTPQGRKGSAACSPTSETNRYDLIGWDDIQASSDRAQRYKETFNLNLNPAVAYTVSGFGAAEDWCDQADFHITICDVADEEVPPSEEPSSSGSSEGQSSSVSSQGTFNPVIVVGGAKAEANAEATAGAASKGDASTGAASKDDVSKGDVSKGDASTGAPSNGEVSKADVVAQAQNSAKTNVPSNTSKQVSQQAKSLPVTGSSSGLLVAGGVALLGLIAGGVYYASRRKSANN